MSHLRVIKEPPNWRTDRACIGTDVRLWFGPGEGEPGEGINERAKREDIAKSYCGECAFTEFCLELELTFPGHDQHGVRGGLTGDERRQLLRERRSRGMAA